MSSCMLYPSLASRHCCFLHSKLLTHPSASKSRTPPVIAAGIVLGVCAALAILGVGLLVVKGCHHNKPPDEVELGERSRSSSA